MEILTPPPPTLDPVVEAEFRRPKPACAAAGVSKSTLYYWMRQGWVTSSIVPCEHGKGVRLIDMASLRTFIRSKVQ